MVSHPVSHQHGWPVLYVLYVLFILTLCSSGNAKVYSVGHLHTGPSTHRTRADIICLHKTTATQSIQRFSEYRAVSFSSINTFSIYFGGSLGLLLYLILDNVNPLLIIPASKPNKLKKVKPFSRRTVFCTVPGG